MSSIISSPAPVLTSAQQAAVNAINADLIALENAYDNNVANAAAILAAQQAGTATASALTAAQAQVQSDVTALIAAFTTPAAG